MWQHGRVCEALHHKSTGAYLFAKFQSSQHRIPRHTGSPQPQSGLCFIERAHTVGIFWNLQQTSRRALWDQSPNVQRPPSLTAVHVHSKDKGIFNTGVERMTALASDLSMKPVSIGCKSHHRRSYNLTPLIPPPYGRCSKYGLSNTCAPVIGDKCTHSRSYALPLPWTSLNNCDRWTDECTMV